MAAARYDFEIEQGTTFVLAFSWKDEAGTPIPLTGYTARMQVRHSVSAEEVLLDLTTENDRLVIDELNGRVTIVLDPVVTAAITWRKGMYDLELVSPTGGVKRLVEGAVTVSREVTR